MDITAALWPCEVEVYIDNDTYTIPALPAADWVATVAQNDALAIVPGLLSDEEQWEIYDRMEDGLPLSEFETYARHALEAAAGRPWWEAQHLVIGSVQAWDVIGGRLLLSGINLSQVSLGAFCNAVYALAVQDMDKKDRMKFDNDLRRPPVEEIEAQGSDDSFVAAQFRAAFAEAQRGG
jgi:hypothetical protein